MTSTIQRIVAVASTASITTCLLMSMEATTSVHGVANETHLGAYGLVVPEIVQVTADLLSRAMVSIGVYSSLLFQYLAMIICIVGLAVHWYPGPKRATGFLTLAYVSPSVMYLTVYSYSGPNTASMWQSSWTYPVILLMLLPVSVVFMTRAIARSGEPSAPASVADGGDRSYEG